MCGILGVCSQTEKINIQLLKSAGEEQNHRGPDSNGIWTSECEQVGLYHNRLAIIDTSSDGSQPFISEKYNLAIIFNGEIYNYIELRNELKELGYSFQTKTDTEVLLIAYVEWGRNFISHLIGMFAFAIYDTIEQTIFLARDRAGEKPLFYMKTENGLVFASELKSIFPFKKKLKVNTQCFNEFLENGFVSNNNCIIEGLNKLPAGNSMYYNLKTGKFNISPYWKVNYAKIENLDNNLKSCVSKLKDLLEKSVERQLRSDVPIGVLLSGGLDSSIITAIASKKISKLNTFTIGFPGYDKLDESKYANEISKAFNTNHTQLNGSPDDFVKYLPKLARTFDEPIIDSSMFPTYLVSELVSDHCKVVLGGDGGDELFAGYMHYSRILLIEKYFKFIPRFIKRTSLLFLSKFVSVNSSIYRYLKLLKVDFKLETPRVATYFSYENRRKLIGLKAININVQSKSVGSSDLKTNLLNRLTIQDFKNYLSEDILVKVDRASMANSLEVRAPMLDRDIIEFAYNQVPSKFKANSKERKILLKKLGEKLLPKNYNYKRKQGFSIPLNDWLRSGLVREYFWDILTSKNSTFEYKMVKNLFDELDSGVNNGERLFGLLIFELWRIEYKIVI
jgi:asparagine synthase (glutamine-hydrolysing)